MSEKEPKDKINEVRGSMIHDALSGRPAPTVVAEDSVNDTIDWRNGARCLLRMTVTEASYVSGHTCNINLHNTSSRRNLEGMHVLDRLNMWRISTLQSPAQAPTGRRRQDDRHSRETRGRRARPQINHDLKNSSCDESLGQNAEKAKKKARRLRTKRQ